MKKTVFAMALGTILASVPVPSAFGQGFSGVWKQSETPDSGERTVDGVWTWDAARKQAVAKWDNGAYAIINVVTDDGKTIVMCRFDPSGLSVGQVADYVGVRKGNTISGKVFWRDPLRDKQRSGKWTATFAGPSRDLAGAWAIAPSANTAFGSYFTDTKTFRLESTAADTFMIAGGNSRSRIRLIKGELQFFNEAGGRGATAKVEQDPKTGAIQRITWSDGSVFTRIAAVPTNPDLSGTWTITPSTNTAFGTYFTKPGTFRLEKTAPETFMIPGGDSRSRTRFVRTELHFYNEAAAFGASGKMELDGGTVTRITWSDGSIWTRKRQLAKAQVATPAAEWPPASAGLESQKLVIFLATAVSGGYYPSSVRSNNKFSGGETVEQTPQYDPDAIQVLPHGEHIRRRPEMYVGHLPNPVVLNRLVEESLCLSVDEAACGNCTEIAVAVHPMGNVTIRDNGPGLPMEPAPDGRPLAEWILTKVGACRAAKRSEATKGACCHMGIVVVNHLSERLRVRIFRDGACWFQEYRAGVAQAPFCRQGDSSETGLEFSFRPDPAIFGPLEFDALALAAWLPSAGVRFELLEYRSGDVALEKPVLLHFTGVGPIPGTPPPNQSPQQTAGA